MFSKLVFDNEKTIVGINFGYGIGQVFTKTWKVRHKKGRLTVDFEEQNNNQSGFKMLVWFILDQWVHIDKDTCGFS